MRSGEVQVKHSGSWVDIDRLPRPVIAYCDHGHVFDDYIEEALGQGGLRTGIEFSVMVAARAGAEIAFYDPGDPSASREPVANTRSVYKAVGEGRPLPPGWDYTDIEELDT